MLLNKPDFIELAYEFPASLPPPRNEDYFRFPVKIAEEMGLETCIYSMRTQARKRKLESVDHVRVRRFDDPFLLLFSAISGKPLIAHGHSFGWIPSCSAPMFIKRYVFTPHVYRLDMYNPNLVKLVASLVGKSRAIIALTKYEANWFAPFADKARIHVIPHPIDFNFFSETEREGQAEVRECFGIDDGLILSVANLVPRKNLETLLKSFKLVNQAMPRTKLIIVGSDPPTVLGVGRPKRMRMPHSQKLKETISMLHLEGKVFLAGYRDSNDLRKFYAAADVFALPSTVEGQLLSAGEAAASGLPLVLSNLEPLVETYDGCALFHSPFDHITLAHHLIDILTDAKLRRVLSQRGRDKMKTYDISSIKPKLKAVYEECLTTK